MDIDAKNLNCLVPVVKTKKALGAIEAGDITVLIERPEGQQTGCEMLRLLEKEGVQIFPCRTCLEFYGLSEKLEIGKATNMFETVDGLLRAGKVIKI